MNKLKIFLILILSLIALSRADFSPYSPNFYNTIENTGFRYFPEDNMIPKDFWGDPNMTLRKAFYPCESSIVSADCPIKYDERNGMLIYPSTFVIIFLNFPRCMEQFKDTR